MRSAARWMVVHGLHPLIWRPGLLSKARGPCGPVSGEVMIRNSGRFWLITNLVLRE